MRRLALTLAVLALAACGGAPPKKTPPSSTRVSVPARNPASAASHAPTQAPPPGCNGSPYARAEEDPRTRGNYTAGGLYAPGVRDSTPGAIDVTCIPEPLITDEAPSAVGNRSPYTVLGKRYTVLNRPDGYVERGTASYYGSKFHGRLTSNQEVYDMYAFSAAHKSLPLPSFARVTNLDNGQSIVVRINDRGPFHDGRLIDLSYAAAVKLGVYPSGTGRVEVRALTLSDNDPSVIASRQQRNTRGRRAAPAPATDSTPDPIAAIAASATYTAAPSMDTAVPSPSSVVTATTVPVAATPPDPIARIATSATTPTGNATPARPVAATPATAGTLSGTTRLAASEPSTQPVRTSQVTRYVASTAPSRNTAMDQLVGALPGETPAPVSAATTAPDAGYTLVTHGVSGRFGDDAGAPAASTAARSTTPSPAADTPSKWLQVGSFASLENARRAMAQLSAAGIVGATLSDVESAGRTMWRLRVQSEEKDVGSMISRLAGLGFGQAHLVRD